MTNALLSAEPGPGGTCRVCGASLGAGARCGTCGAAYGEANRCPHCRAVTDVEPHAGLGFRCRVCGGPRVPVDDPTTLRSGREIRLLAQVRRDDVRASLFRAGGAVLFASFGLSLLVTLFVLSVASPGLFGTFAALAACSVPLILASYAWRKGGKARAAAKDALDQAWLLVASDVARSKGKELEAAELAKALRIDEARAEQLLAELSVNDFVHARIGSDASAPDRVRIAFGEEAEVPALAEPPQAQAEQTSTPKS
jgi:hypothetical protein